MITLGASPSCSCDHACSPVVATLTENPWSRSNEARSDARARFWLLISLRYRWEGCALRSGSSPQTIRSLALLARASVLERPSLCSPPRKTRIERPILSTARETTPSARSSTLASAPATWSRRARQSGSTSGIWAVARRTPTRTTTRRTGSTSCSSEWGPPTISCPQVSPAVAHGRVRRRSAGTDHFGSSTVSITWMTPLEALITVAPLIIATPTEIAAAAEAGQCRSLGERKPAIAPSAAIRRQPPPCIEQSSLTNSHSMPGAGANARYGTNQP